jgi:hypothetical protein
VSHRHSWVCQECGGRKQNGGTSDERRARVYAWRLANPERNRDIQRRYETNNPHIVLVGEHTRVRALPEALRPVALTIRETRLEIRRQQREGVRHGGS